MVLFLVDGDCKKTNYFFIYLLIVYCNIKNFIINIYFFIMIPQNVIVQYSIRKLRVETMIPATAFFIMPRCLKSLKCPTFVTSCCHTRSTLKRSAGIEIQSEIIVFRALILNYDDQLIGYAFEWYFF
jgi:hypothetical protein